MNIDYAALMTSPAYQWSLFVVLVSMALKLWFNPDPRKIVGDHVVYIHATLGMGKTALAAHWVHRVLNPYNPLHRLLSALYRRPLRPVPVVFATFELRGARPLSLGAPWPSERGAKIVIDEILLLESNDLLRIEWFSRGCTLARQLGQQVVLISQASRLPPKLRKFHGTIGLFVTMKGVSFGSLGRIIFTKRAAEPFVRRSKGFKADGQKTAAVWIPGSVFTTYNSRKIYGYTVDEAGQWIDREAETNAAGVNNQGAAYAPEAKPTAAAHEPLKLKPKRVHRVKRAV